MKWMKMRKSESEITFTRTGTESGLKKVVAGTKDAARIGGPPES